MANPWLNSTDLIENVKRKISFPIYQSTFTDNDVLLFANDEIRDSLLPNIMQYHEEFFVTSSATPLVLNKSSYAIPNRAVGMKLRDLGYGDGQGNLAGLPYGNLYEMTRVNADDKAWFQTAGVSNQVPYKYYVEGNNVVVIPAVTSNPSGQLVFYWFMRPNQLVEISRSFTVSEFSKTITVNNATLVPGDTVTLGVFVDATVNMNTPSTTNYVFTAVAGSPAAFEFQIGGTSSASASNLVAAINAAMLGFSANNGTPATNSVLITYSNRNNTVASSNATGLVVQVTLGLASDDPVPANITDGSKVDLLQTLPGHKTLNYDVIVPTGGVSGSTLSLNESDVPTNFIVGDYICSQNECIIPQIPPELHSSLAQRVAARMLEAIGDKEGLAVASVKIQDLDKQEGRLIDDRVTGSPQKVLARHTVLRYNGFWGRRRY